MERESFEDEEVARVLNQGFVSIKVDREERPDVDAAYMEAVQRMTGRGGWPMTVIMTTAGHPFFGGTYLSKAALLGVLQRVRAAWRDQRGTLERQGDEIAVAVARQAEDQRAGALDERVLQAFLSEWNERFDGNGGRRGAPKFPPGYDLRLLLRIHRRTGSPAALASTRKTLDEMARGGVYDHVGGGFHRYSVDARWGVPHFEKMLYDQASLAVAYLEAWEATGEREYELVVRETLDYVLRDMTDPSGGVCSAEDADSGGVEGAFYSWSATELRAALPPREYEAIQRAFEFTESGNGEAGRNILRARGSRSRAGRDAVTRSAVARLLAARSKRPRPLRDDKILTDWNGLMIATLARAGRSLPEPRYVEAAERAARFLLQRVRRPDGRLYHRWRAGAAAIPGFVDGYAFLTHGLIELYQADFDAHWLDEAAALFARQRELFYDAGRGVYRRDDGSDPLVIAHHGESYDGVVPAARSITALNALRLADLLANPEPARHAAEIFAATPRRVADAPRGFPQLLIALDYALDRSKGIAVVGNPTDPALQRLVLEIRRGFQPNQVLAAGPGGDGPRVAPILRGRPAKGGRPTAYVCEDGLCGRPTTVPQEARTLAATIRTYPEAAPSE